MGEVAERIKLPKISGYILAGILLNPDLLPLVPAQFVDKTDPLLTAALSLITFSIGNSLSFAKIRASGKTIILLVLFESVAAFLFVFLLLFVTLYFFFPAFASVTVALAVSMVLGSLASPTDPSATLAVIHEYQAKGVVSASMLQISAFDDITGIIIYTVVTAFAASSLSGVPMAYSEILLTLGRDIGGAVLCGVLVGVVFNAMTRLFKKQSEGSLIVLVLGTVFLSYGLASYFNFEAMLATMTLGAMITNFNPLSDSIFKLIERYTDELIFVVFFTLSGMHLQLSAVSGSFLLIVIYILSRAAGKFSGIFAGAALVRNVAPAIRKYTAGGLIPQGGIVIGLALLIAKEPVFKDTASMIVSVVIGAALIHELLGPVMSKYSLKKAGELDG